MVAGAGWFKKMNKEHHWPRKFSGGPSWRWKRPSLRFSAFLDDVAFHILYVVEAVVLVAGVCCFFLCCGCHF